MAIKTCPRINTPPYPAAPATERAIDEQSPPSRHVFSSFTKPTRLFLMSSTTTIATASRQRSFRLSPVSSSRIQLKQIPYPHQRQAAHSGERGLGSLFEMSSAAYYGQRSMGYEAGPPDPEPYGYSAPVTRSWANGRGAQNWSEDYQSYSQPQVAQRQQYQPPQQQQVLAQTRQAAPPASYASRQSTRPTTPTSTHSSHTLSSVSANADAQSMVMHSLQIPARISSKAGNLAEFSAQVSYLYSGQFERPAALSANPLLLAHVLVLVRESQGPRGGGGDKRCR